MAADPSSLHGDGINFAFFNLLWSKSDDGAREIVQTTSTGQQDSKPGKTSSILRLPDTVVFLFGQPHQWYFTSKNGGPHKNKTTILRKKRVNLTLANIEEVFLSKTSSLELGEDDVVAYFISSKGDGMEQLASLDACNAVADDASSCNIEYLNKQALRDFLQHGRNNKSGILQRFVAPHGGGRHNSQIRAIWTPKLCILERRQTKQDLHDPRFALYERCITFDGPDVHSVSVPLRGTVLAGQVENICKDIVEHLAHVAAENAHVGSKVLSSTSKKCTENTFVRVARMVVNFKVDGNGKVWILWSNSIRLESVAVENRMKLTESDAHSLAHAASSRPLNMEAVVRLPPSIKLTQAPNHNVNMTLENKLLTATCPSCSKHDANPHFQPVPYKTVIQHYEKTLKMLEEDDVSHPSKVWPPEDLFIKSAGDVGFGSLPMQLARDRETNPSKKYSEETRAIPPVIREIHPNLRVKGYSVYRNDPLFLLKTASVCETCFLSYAQLTSTSFVQLTARPVEPFESDKGGVRYNFPDCENDKAQKEGRKKNAKVQTSVSNIVCKDVGCVQPEFPPVIMEPPQVNIPSIPPESSPLRPKDTLFNTLPMYFPPSTEYAKKNLGHMIQSHKMLADIRGSEKPPAETYKNPYEEKFVL